ncbi:UV radiation resistance protein and autophagy-related subunit 14-domain-containing protein [Chytriomyces cf. hyalinus JEL632]|nr:UV radiation resistance protein and autophagy-related subunit 14-domain-containing protein [Chytriomyces cf. hyalinus JEL632]
MDQSHEKRNRTVTTCFACGSSAFGNSAAVVPAIADPSTAAVRNARRGAAASQSVCGPCVYSSTAASLSATAALETESARNEADITWLLQSRGVFTSTGVLVNRHRNCRHSDSVAAAIASLRTRIESDRVKLAAAKETLLARKAGLARARDHAHALIATKNQTLLAECRATNEKLLRSNEVATTCRRMLMRELVGVFRLRRVQRASSTSLAPTSSSSPAHTSFNFQHSASPVSAQRSEFAPHSIEQSTSTSNLSPSTPTAYSLPSAMEAHKAIILETPELQASPNAKIAVSLFYDTPLEFRLINVGFSCFGDYYLYPREKFNAALGHIVHMVIVMCHYLGVTLPFQLVYGGSKSLIKPGVVDVHTLLGTRSENADGVSGVSSSLPLFLDSNVDLFTIGLTLLNYDILYLCQTQGVTIPLHLGANTLENLAACCRATKLGRYVRKSSLLK